MIATRPPVFPMGRNAKRASTLELVSLLRSLGTLKAPDSLRRRLRAIPSSATARPR